MLLPRTRTRRRHASGRSLSALALVLAGCASPADDGAQALAEPLVVTLVRSPASDAFVNETEGSVAHAALFENVNDGTSYASSDDRSTVRGKAGVRWTAHASGFASVPAGRLTAVSVFYRASAPPAAGARAIIRVYDGDTVIASGPFRLLGTWTDYREDFTGLSLASAAHLNVRVTFDNASGVGSPAYSNLWVSLGINDTTRPTVSLTSPLTGTTVRAGTPVSLGATATDGAGIAKVEFYREGDLVATSTAAPFAATWTPNANQVGDNQILAKAYDRAGNVAQSSVVDVTVGPNGATDGNARFRLHTPAWRGIGGDNAAGYARVADAFDWVFGHYPTSTFRPYSAVTKTIQYTLGPYADEGQYRDLVAHAPNALAHGVEGTFPLYPGEFPGNYLVVPDNAAWITSLEDKIDTVMARGSDGLLLDSMGTGPVGSGYLVERPINPATHQAYTSAQWLEAERVMVAAAMAHMKANHPGRILTLNGLANGRRYSAAFAESPRYLLSQTDDVSSPRLVDGAMSEITWRDPRAKVDAFSSADDWLLDLQMIEDVERRGLLGFFWTKCWSDAAPGATLKTSCRYAEGSAPLVRQWLSFALASHMLAAGERNYFNFDTDMNDDPSNAAEYFPEYDRAFALGRATGPRTEVAGGSGVFERPYESGLAIVNPGSASRTITLDGTYVDLSGATRTSITLAPHTGDLLLRR